MSTEPYCNDGCDLPLGEALALFSLASKTDEELHPDFPDDGRLSARYEKMGITVTRRNDDWHAAIEGEPGYWNCGKSAPEAVGNLIRTHPERFATLQSSLFPTDRGLLLLALPADTKIL